jgi:Kef-type K+ transport system membrane component KefB
MNELSLLLLLLASLLTTLLAVRWLSDSFDQPSVLGELLLGVLLGNLGVFFGEPLFEILMNPESTESVAESAPVAAHVATVFQALAEIGAVLLLFSAGLETSVAKMRRVGGRATVVALVGVVAPFSLAYLTCLLLHVEMDVAGHLFLAATLSATSVGITASVLKDLKAIERPESEVILGAAVIDDVLGLVLLAIVSRIAISGSVDGFLVGKTLAIAMVFIVVVIFAGERLAATGLAITRRLDKQNGLLYFALAFAFAVSWIAQSVGLAAIVGAFAAGLVMRNSTPNGKPENNGFQANSTVLAAVSPIERFLSPLFFLYVGMQVDVRFFLNTQTLLLALVFCVCAVIGKLMAGLVAGRDLDRLSIGIGMVPRGEVGLVFLGAGRSLGVISDSLFAALAIVVFVTTLITPPALKWAIGKEVGSEE